MDGIRDRAVGRSNANSGVIVGRGVDAAHDTLVIALEEDADKRERLDGDVEPSWGELSPCAEIGLLEAHREVKGKSTVWMQVLSCR